MKLELGTEGPLVPEWDFYPQPETGERRGSFPTLCWHWGLQEAAVTPSQSKAALCIFGRKSSLEPDQLVHVPAPLSY